MQSISVSTDGSTWQAGTATVDHFFTFSGGPYNYPLKIQLTSIFGETSEWTALKRVSQEEGCLSPPQEGWHP